MVNRFFLIHNIIAYKWFLFVAQVKHCIYIILLFTAQDRSHGHKISQFGHFDYLGRSEHENIHLFVCFKEQKVQFFEKLRVKNDGNESLQIKKIK